MQLQKEQKKSPFQNDQKAIMNKKLEIMDIFCTLFFKVDHRCVFNYMSHLTSKHQNIKEEDLLKFCNASNILVDFVEAFFISKYQISERKQTKKKVAYYKIDFNFFKILPDLMEKIIKNVNDARQPFLDQKVKTLKICKKCKIVRGLAEAQFGFQCGNTINGSICGCNQLQDMLRNDSELNRIQKIISITDVLKIKRKQVEDLQIDLQKRKMQQKQSDQQKKINQIDKFMYQIETVLKENNIQYPKIPITYANIREAQSLHAPLSQYKKVNEMIEYKKRRKANRRV